MDNNDSVQAPKFARLVFPREGKLYETHVRCLYNNDSFTEILNEELDSFVLNPWSWSQHASTTGLMAVLFLVITAITVIMNGLFIGIFIREKMLSANYFILIAMAVSDSLTVLIPTCAIVYMYTDGKYPDYIPYEYCRLWGYLTKYLPTITHNASIWLTLVLAVQRYLIIRKPFIARRLCVRRTSLSAIITVYILATLSHLCRFLDTEYVPVKIIPVEIATSAGYTDTTENNSQIHINKVPPTTVPVEQICNSSNEINTCRAVYTETFSRFGVWYEFCYYWFVILFVKFIPCTCLIVLDTLMLKSLRHSEMFRLNITVFDGEKSQSLRSARRESRRMTIVLVVVIIIVIMVELPIGVILVLWTLDIIHSTATVNEKTLSTMARVANSVIYVSYPIIFTLYCCMCVKFRKALCRFFCRKKRDSQQSPF